MANISTIRRQVRDAPSALERRTQQTRLVIALVTSSTYFGPVQKAFSVLADRIAARLSEGAKAPEIREVIQDARPDITAAVQRAVEGITRQVVRLNDDDLASNLNPARIHAATGFPTDAQGNILPAPGRYRNVRQKNPDFDQVISAVSGLLFVNGTKTVDPVEYLRGNSESEAKRLARSRPSTEFRGDRLRRVRTVERAPRGWRNRLSRILSSAFGRLAGIVTSQARKAERNETPLSRVTQFIRSRFGIGRARQQGTQDTPQVGTGGTIRQIQLVIRQQALENLERDKQRDYDTIPQSVLAGYSLHSVFAERTRPDHSGRDGWRFYRDNRDGSNLPWARRIIPPYAYNCLCFTRQIWQDPDGAEFFAAWEATPRFRGSHIVTADDVGGFTFEDGEFRRITSDEIGTRIGRKKSPQLMPRDVGLYETWFDQQNLGTRLELVGERRMAALQTNGVANPRYRDFVRTDGRFMSANSLARESRSRRRNRSRRVGRLIRKTVRTKEQALRDGNLLPSDDQSYLNRLRVFLERAGG